MSRKFSIETMTEDAFVASLHTWLDESVAVTRWDDVADKDLMPMVRIKAYSSEDLPGTVNHFLATTVMVEIGVFTSKRDDLDGRDANSIMSDVRAMLNESNVVDLLNIIDGLLVYNNGVMPTGSSTIEDPRNWHRAMTVTVVATTQ